MKPSFTEEMLKEAHKASLCNKDSILRSTQCGCFNCCRIMKPSSVIYQKEANGQKTGVCPYCYIDSVIGDASGYPITKEFLEAMQERWF